MSSELRKYGSTSVAQTSNIGFTSEVSDYLVVHTGPDHVQEQLRHTVLALICIAESALKRNREVFFSDGQESGGSTTQLSYLPWPGFITGGDSPGPPPLTQPTDGPV